MSGNGKVFISHAHADNERCQPLLAALDAWAVDYWFDTEQMKAGDALARRIQNAITERDVFIRVCTVAAQSSYWMDLEEDAFRALQAEDQRQGKSGKRVLITIVLDTQYQLTPFERAAIFIDAARHARQEWLRELQRALGVADASAPAAVPAPVAVPHPAASAAASDIASSPSRGSAYVSPRYSANPSRSTTYQQKSRMIRGIAVIAAIIIALIVLLNFTGVISL